MSDLVPYAHALNLYDINPDFFVKIGIKYLLLDLDNTLDTHKDKMPSERAKNYIQEIKNRGIKPIIISNNNYKRVKTYADACEVEFLYRMGKPFAHKLKKFVKSLNTDTDYVIMVGDQLLTDVKVCKKVGIRCILTEKLWPGDQFITKFLRWIDMMRRKKYKSNGLLIDWREIYGRIK